MNEGHAALLAFELLDEQARPSGPPASSRRDDIEAVRAACVFTTHTPVPAGHDQFPLDLVTARCSADAQICAQREMLLARRRRSNMTYLALNLSHYVNGVAKRHGEVSQPMFAGYRIDSITNGVHAATWTRRPFQELFDRTSPAGERTTSACATR